MLYLGKASFAMAYLSHPDGQSDCQDKARVVGNAPGRKKEEAVNLFPVRYIFLPPAHY